MSLAFAVTAEMALISLGGGLKRKESLSGRLGDVLSLLYLGSAVLKHHHDNGSPEDELPLLEWACQDLLHGIQTRLREVLATPSQSLRCRSTHLLTCSHWANPTSAPLMKLGQRVGANLILEPGALRDRLTEAVYIPVNKTEAVARLSDDALEKNFAAEPAIRKLRSAMTRSWGSVRPRRC